VRSVNTHTEPLSDDDLKTLNALKGNEWFVLMRLYGSLFIGLGYVYYKFLRQFKPHPQRWREMSVQDFQHVYEIFAVVFATLFFLFLIRDYRRMILPFNKEIRGNEKYCLHFSAFKYDDPVFGKHLIFYPDKKDIYIEFEKEEFDLIQDGDILYLETGVVTCEILLLKSEFLKFKSAAEFSFSEA
jgi:hypothetical protein